jgi:hypothetical protein
MKGGRRFGGGKDKVKNMYEGRNETLGQEESKQ